MITNTHNELIEKITRTVDLTLDSEACIREIQKIIRQHETAKTPRVISRKELERAIEAYWGNPIANQTAFESLDEPFKNEMREGMRDALETLGITVDDKPNSKE